jgi:hypothetical protein
MKAQIEMRLDKDDEGSRRATRRTGWCIAAAVITLFAGTFLAKWVGLLPAPLPQ